jgi:hypothetical protein
MKPSFVLIESRRNQIVPLLRSAAPAFFSSAEYRIVEGNDDLPGVILAAFGGYLRRSTRDAQSIDELNSGAAAINELYGWNDPGVRESIRDEFIESFTDDPEGTKAIEPFLCEGLVEEFARMLANLR